MYRHNTTVLVLSCASVLACERAVPPSGDPYSESTVDGGCKDGDDNDQDGKTDCDDRDCDRAPACRWDSGGWRDTDRWHDTDGGDDTDDGHGEGVSFAIAWNPSGLIVEVINGYGSYELGLADTDPANPDPWTGEDCLNGYTSSDGETWSLCHQMPPYGTSLTTVTSVDDLIEGETTLLSEEQEGTLTYYVISLSTGDCWVWGLDPAYYSGQGCVEIWAARPEGER